MEKETNALGTVLLVIALLVLVGGGVFLFTTQYNASSDQPGVNIQI